MKIFMKRKNYFTEGSTHIQGNAVVKCLPTRPQLRVPGFKSIYYGDADRYLI